MHFVQYNFSFKIKDPRQRFLKNVAVGMLQKRKVLIKNLSLCMYMVIFLFPTSSRKTILINQERFKLPHTVEISPLYPTALVTINLLSHHIFKFMVNLIICDLHSWTDIHQTILSYFKEERSYKNKLPSLYLSKYSWMEAGECMYVLIE